MKVYAQRFVDSQPISMENVVPGITKNWMGITNNNDPVMGWPFQGLMTVHFRGHVPLEDQDRMKALIKDHFDGGGATTLFPIESISFESHIDDDEGEFTIVKIQGDLERARASAGRTRL